MWKCQRCGKPVYFAERRQSLGFDWHRECLRCQECDKVLNPGQHAEHKGVPFCHIPCYSVLFGPKLFGHGSTVGSHQSFGQHRRNDKNEKERKLIEKNLKHYNDYFVNNDDKSTLCQKRFQISSRNVNGRFVLEGVLRVYWGIERSIRLKEYDDKRVNRNVKSLSLDLTQQIQIIERVPSSEDDDSSGNEEEANAKTGIDEDKSKQRCKSLDSSSPCSSLISDDNSHKKAKHYFETVHYKTLPAKLDPKVLGSWDEFDDLLSVERPISDKDKLYHTVHSNLFMASTQEEDKKPLNLKELFLPQNQIQRSNDANMSKNKSRFRVVSSSITSSCNDDRISTKTSSDDQNKNANKVNLRKYRGLHRRHGRKFDKCKLKRRCSMNGHWYDRDTSVFTPPKDSSMCVTISSLNSTKEVIDSILKKYQVESDPGQFALYVIKENGERRIVSKDEFPLLLRVNLGPSESVSKLYIMDQMSTDEIGHDVAQYIRFSFAELRAILNMFYEEEEREAEKIRQKYQIAKAEVQRKLLELQIQ